MNTILCQITYNSSPQIYKYELPNNIPVFKTENLNLEIIDKENIISKKKSDAYKFGYNFDVDINFFELAICEELDNGDKIYRLQIETNDAYSINFIFNQFVLSEGTQLYIYNQDLSHVIGAFTDQNNKVHKRFSTSPIKGDSVILEFYEPKFSMPSIINISSIINGYKNI